MADNTEKSSAYTIAAGLLAVMLVAAAGIVYWQYMQGDDNSGSRLAALSQAIPLHATNAAAGDMAAFERLESSMNELALARGGTFSGLPGGAQAWQELERGAQAVMASRADIRAISEASAYVREHTPMLLAASEALMEASGNTAVLQ
ncbi:MAG: hypothetical protein KJO31_13665, partial [Gammaproteobacteria bacterium]|nr:hypothetical protein [Gammaproteobacteria bacterium]